MTSDPVNVPHDAPDTRRRLEQIVARVGKRLPAQGPISVFIHHNPLHELEHLPFEEAALEAAQLYACEPLLSEDRYRAELLRGRIDLRDLEAELVADLDALGDAFVVDGLTRIDLRRRLLRHGIPELSREALRWTLQDSSLAVTDRFGPLWRACLRAVTHTSGPALETRRRPRHRDLLLEHADLDIDEWVQPVLSRVTSGFLDQGLADWAMPGRERGLFACFVDLYQGPLARFCQPFGAQLQPIVREQAAAARAPLDALADALVSLGVPEPDWESFLLAEAIPLRGFAGLVHQFELRPDRVPVFSVPARLVDFLAMRLTLVRAALEHAASRVGYDGKVEDFHAWVVQRLPPAPTRSEQERAWPLFHVAELVDWSTDRVDALSEGEVISLEQELGTFDGMARRRLLHRAFERNLRHRFFDVLLAHRSDARPTPAYQAMFCIDEREESIRRQLEEVDPDVETFGAAGFFGVGMYFQGATDASARPLCPIGMTPRQFVGEVHDRESSSVGARLRRGWSRAGSLLDKGVQLSGRRARLGALLFATAGVLWVIPLVLRVLFPWLSRRLALPSSHAGHSRGRLVLDHDPNAPPPLIGERAGFTKAEMADIVWSQLAPSGIADRLSPLVLVFGHGSTSLNNPHESAHDCGACGGGRGGPNARAFAAMANDEVVRGLLRDRGLLISDDTWFVGGERNTANNEFHLFDLDAVPESARPLLERARKSLDEARREEAHERCRRFESAPTWLPAAAALLHVETRATDLAQPRPEYGHATNAVCFVGRRSRTRGLFLDRRAFLVSYDPLSDVDGTALPSLLAAVVPVVAGINLEYYFGTVDPTGYGSGTKLPHNITGLIGVIDGAASDLRVGLPWQMVEIHEPVRLTVVVEASVEQLQSVVAANPDLCRLVDNAWLFVAALDPHDARITEVTSTTTRSYERERPPPTSRGPSRRYYEGRRDHLPFATLDTQRGTSP